MARKKEPKTAAVVPQPQRVKFHYIKSNDHRVIRADGIFGGPVPAGDAIYMAIWSERPPIPLEVVHEVKDGHLGPEVRAERVCREGFVREVGASVLIDLARAKSLHKWLEQQIDHLEKTAAKVREAQATQQSRKPGKTQARARKRTSRSTPKR